MATRAEAATGNEMVTIAKALLQGLVGPTNTHRRGCQNTTGDLRNRVIITLKGISLKYDYTWAWKKRCKSLVYKG